MKKVMLILMVLISPTLLATPLKDDQFKVGEARFKYLFWKIYDSSLFAEDQTYRSINQELTLNIDYKRNIPKKRIVEATQAQWEKLNYEQNKIEKWSEQMDDIIPEISKNDQLAFHKDTEGVGAFYYNNELIAKIEDKELSEAFLSIWLSKNTSQPKLRRRLIGD